MKIHLDGIPINSQGNPKPFPTILGPFVVYHFSLFSNTCRSAGGMSPPQEENSWQCLCCARKGKYLKTGNHKTLFIFWDKAHYGPAPVMGQGP